MTLTPDNNTDPWATTHEYRAILRELAEKATPGPWFAKQLAPMSRPQLLASLDREWLHPDGSPGQREYFFLTNQPEETDGISPCQTGNGPTSAANARFIAAANPAVVLALLDEVGRLRAENADLRAQDEAAANELERLAPLTSDVHGGIRELVNAAQALRAENEKLRDNVLNADERAELKKLRDADGDYATIMFRIQSESDRVRADNADLRAELSVANDLVAELQATNAKLRAKCEERKAWIEQNDPLEWIDSDTMRCHGCGAYIYRSSERIGQCNPDCAWKRAMEDV